MHWITHRYNITFSVQQKCLILIFVGKIVFFVQNICRIYNNNVRCEMVGLHDKRHFPMY